MDIDDKLPRDNPRSENIQTIEELEKKKIERNSFKAVFKRLIFNFHYLIFLIVISAGTIISLWLNYGQYQRFALGEKLFEVADIFKTDSTSLLTQKFACPANSATGSWCGFDALLLLLILLFIEVFSLWIILKRRKIVAKRFLITYLLIQQLYPVLILILYGYIPYIVVRDLSKQATQEITKSVSVLASSEERAKLGIIDTVDGVSEVLEKSTEPPVFFEYEPEAEAVLQLQKISHAEKDTLYRSAIIPATLYASASASLKAQIRFDALLFPSNILIVKSASQGLVEQLTPVLTRKLISAQYAQYTKRVKNPPKISVLEDEKYLVVLQKKQEEHKRELLGSMQEVRNGLREFDNVISQLQSAITASDAEYSRYESYGRGWRNECESGLSPNDPFCVKGKETIESNLQQIRTNKSQMETQIKEYTDARPKWLWALGQWQKAYEDFLKDPVAPEFQGGIFLPPSNIYIKYNPKGNYPFSQYLQTLVHEYLHYEGNDAADQFPKFLEEGVTDYLASDLVKKFLQTQSLVIAPPDYSGYPELVETVTLLMKRLPKEDVLQAYFARQEYKIKDLVDKQYGKGVYDRVKNSSNQIYFTSVKDVGTKASILSDVKTLLSQSAASESGRPDSK